MKRQGWTIAKWFLAALGLTVIAIVNGAVRKAVYADALGFDLAHQVSTGTGIVLFGLFIGALMRKWRASSRQEAIVLWVGWLVFAVVFEFTFGHYVMGNPWSALLADYNLLAGRTWPLVLAWTAIAPVVFQQVFGARMGDGRTVRNEGIQCRA